MYEDEINAYKHNRDTFFGVYHEQAKVINSPLDMFDFYKKSFNLLSKEELLNRLKRHPQYENLMHKDQEELLEIYCEAITSSVYNKK